MQMINTTTSNLWTSTSTAGDISVDTTQEKIDARTMDEQILDAKKAIVNATANGADDTTIDTLLDKYTELKAAKEKLVNSESAKEILEKPLDAYTEADIARRGKEGIRKDTQKDLTEQAMKNI